MSTAPSTLPRVVSLTALAMVAFAANSIVCRLALARDSIDPLSFTGIRLVSGAAVLVLVVRLFDHAKDGPSGASWASAAALFAYAVAFSLAYVRLDAGVGALLLFGAVQLTMIGWGISKGERLGIRQLVGLGLAVAGLLTLTWPGELRVEPTAAGSMILAGVAWGIYSVRGRGVARPIATTAGNFVRAAIPSASFLLLPAVGAGTTRLTLEGALLAASSGAIFSGLGYVIWYAALRGLLATRAAIVQLSVPILAGFGGIVILNERLTPRLALAACATLGGISLALRRR